MSVGRSLPPAGVPTLTEVLATPPANPDSAAAAPGSAGIEADSLVAAVLAELLPRIDLMFELRLREAFAPALARAEIGRAHV